MSVFGFMGLAIDYRLIATKFAFLAEKNEVCRPNIICRYIIIYLSFT